MSALTLVGVTHEFQKKRSLALLVWNDDPEKKISVPIPFGCPVDRTRQEAEKAVRDLAKEMATIAVDDGEAVS
jgi:hypothetical protein